MADNTKITFLLIILLVAFATISYAITDFDAPVPTARDDPDEPVTPVATGPITITAHGKSALANIITVNKAGNLEIAVSGLSTEKLFIGLKKDVPANKVLNDFKDVVSITSPPNVDFETEVLPNGIAVRVGNETKQASKTFVVKGWDKKDLLVTVCQDKDASGKCEAANERTQVTVKFEELSTESLLETLAILDKSFAEDLTVEENEE